MSSARRMLLPVAFTAPVLLFLGAVASPQAKPLAAGQRAQQRSSKNAPDAADARLFGQTPAEFATRREAVRKAAEQSVVLLRSAPYPDDRIRYRTDNDLLYLTGVEAQGAYLALLPPGDPTGKREILFLPGGPRQRAQWTDAPAGPGEATRRATGIESVQSMSALWETLSPSLKRSRTVFVSGPTGDAAKYSPSGQTQARILEINPEAQLRNAGSLIHPLRWQKSAGEIANLRAAIAATGQAERNAARAIRPGVQEIAVEGTILSAFRAGGAEREAFPCIVGSGPNSCILHHWAGGRKIQAKEMVVVDIGAEYNYYAADVTRTFPCGGKFTPRQREIYQLVLDTQRACEKYVKPGKTTLRELHRYAVSFMQSSPLRAQDEQGKEHTMDAFFVHALGHWLGMDVHDVGGRSNVLEPGVVFTIEPGIYVAGEQIGVRIEDDYLVTADGVEKLSKDIPSEVSEIEKLMRR